MAGTKDITGKVKTTKPVVPMIYSYTTPQIAEHDGWSKIGYTEQDVDQRIAQQVKTANVKAVKQWAGRAEYDDGHEPLIFRDHEFHGYLTKIGVERTPKTEWFHVDGDTGKAHFRDFRENRGILETDEPVPYELRDEQERAVEQTALWLESHQGNGKVEPGEFLWNAKPRFGKTLTAYAFCRFVEASRVLILTNRPSIADSWYNDYARFLGTQSGYWFVSEVQALAGKPHVLTRSEYAHLMATKPKDERPRVIEFVSLQDLKGGVDFGGKFDKLAHVKDLDWDVLIMDEAHEGVDTAKTDVALAQIRRGFTLHLSGTPFKALANDKFDEHAIFNWTYADEQAAKAAWDEDHPGETNPYGDLPRLNLFTYKMSDIVETQAAEGIVIDGETHEYAFDLNEFFACDENGRFRHDADVDAFLDALCSQTKFPFSTPSLRDELRHTLWLVGGNPRPTDSARALQKKLAKHPVFKDYEVVLAVGDGRDQADDAAQREALSRVRAAIEGHDRTITLSVGQLTTGITVPEWTAVLMLSNMRSASLYMQAAFRAQNPWLSHGPDGTFRRKENAYVFDFDPARTLTIYEEFANDLASDTAGGKGMTDDRKRHVRELLNFFPVLGEDEDGEMVELDAEKVLLIPRRIHAVEVVRHGFISNFLFQNIGRVFNAPQAVIDAIYAIQEYKPEKDEHKPDKGDVEALDVNEDGEVEVPRDTVVGLSNDIFGEKVFGDVVEQLGDLVDSLEQQAGATRSEEDDALDRLVEQFVSNVTDPIVEAASDYTSDLKASQRKRVETKIKAQAQAELNRQVGTYKAERNRADLDLRKALDEATTDEERDEAHAEHAQRIGQAAQGLKDGLKESRDKIVHDAGEGVVEAVETAKREAKKKTIEDEMRLHLNGFARTIPSFLMAYGDEDTTLASFDQIVPEEVFEEVTRNTSTGECVTLDMFRLFRDGGDVADPETGELQHFDGHIFDEVVFDDAVREFVRLRTELANYFEPGQERVIFDYIPPQRTNQIFTSRKVVRDMVDMLERENPGCFDDPTHTFADLYMKSGMYVTEIVTRLFSSPRMRELFPDDHERLRHIFEHQVFGAAPTQILYDITTNFILGYRGEVAGDFDTNFVCADTAELAKEGKLAAWVEETFGAKLGE